MFFVHLRRKSDSNVCVCVFFRRGRWSIDWLKALGHVGKIIFELYAKDVCFVRSLELVMLSSFMRVSVHVSERKSGWFARPPLLNLKQDIIYLFFARISYIQNEQTTN